VMRAAATKFDAAEIIDAESDDDSVWIPSASATLVNTANTLENLSKLAAAVNSKEFTLLTGETGAGKTALVKYLAHMTRNRLRQVNMHDQTDEVELFGGYKPAPDGGFVWRDGTITSAIRNGHWLLLDELNLADQAVLERMNPLLDGEGHIVLTEKEDKERVKVHSRTRVFATQNPASYAGRKELSAAMFDRFQRKIYMRRLPDTELNEVLKKDFSASQIVGKLAESFPDLDKETKSVLRGNVLNSPEAVTPTSVVALEAAFGNSDKNALKELHRQFAANPSLDAMPIAPKAKQVLEAFQGILANPPAPVINDKVLLQMSILHNEMVKASEGRVVGKKGGPYPFTLRDLLKLAKRIKHYSQASPELNQFQLAWQQARDIYRERFMEEADQQTVEHFFQLSFGDPKVNRDGAPPETNASITMEKVGNNIRIGDTTLEINPNGGDYVPDAGAKLISTPGTVKKLTRLARAAALDEPVLLVGPTAAGKTSLVRWLAHETNNEFRRVNLSNHTDTSELIGGYYPAVEVDFDRANAAIKAIEGNADLAKRFQATIDKMDDDVKKGFEILKSNPNLEGDAAKEAQKTVRDAIGRVLGDDQLRVAFEDLEDTGAELRNNLEGAFRTVPGKFEWRDGIIIEAMKKGQWIVLDEINLAEPAVLERLNSLLDNDRAVVLTEHLGERIKADSRFRIFATMNPATNDYGGRKELSPAMRNRFTEQWFPDITERSEILHIANAWVEEFKGGAQEYLKGFDANTASREDKLKALSAQAFLKEDTSRLAEAVTDFQITIRAKAKRQNGQTPELPTAKKDGYHYTLRGMRAWLKYIKNNVGRPMQNPDDPKDRSLRKDLKTVFNEGVEGYYVDGLSRAEDQQTVKSLGESLANRL
ncbi:MAG: AAA family ATPase, partial [Candidatus Eremiobacteraeota bacterium]|nr:AAA family ATPase [Candidatus Eremiobacteraeota bacterium]